MITKKKPRVFMMNLPILPVESLLLLKYAVYSAKSRHFNTF